MQVILNDSDGKLVELESQKSVAKSLEIVVHLLDLVF